MGHKRKSYYDMTLKQKILVYQLPIILAVYYPASSIQSFVKLQNAYSSLKAVADDVQSIRQNWESKPIIDIKIIKNGESCPINYYKGSSTKRVGNEIDTWFAGIWPGAQAMCKCGISGNVGCVSGDAIDPSLPKRNEVCRWSYIVQYCKTSDKKGKCTSSGSRTQIDQLTDSIGQCSTNQTKSHCTQIQSSSQKTLLKWPLRSFNYKNVVNKGVLCIKRGDISSKNRPILQSNATCQVNYKKCGTICSPSTHECPISQFSINTTTLNLTIQRVGTGNSFYSLPAVNLVMSDGIPCESSYYNDGSVNPTKQLAKNNKAFETLKGNCKKNGYNKDTRQKNMAEIDQWSLFNGNNIGQVAGNINAYNTKPENQGSKWQLWLRPEIQWNTSKSECTIFASKQKVSKNTDSVLKLKNAQYIIMILNGIFGIGIFGLIFPMIILCNLFDKDQDVPCIPGEGLEEARNIGIIKGILGLIAILAKEIVLIPSYLETKKIVTYFEAVASYGCTGDLISYKTFESIAKMIRTCYQNNQKAFIIDILMIIITAIGWFYICCKRCKVDKTLYEDEQCRI